MKPLSARDPIGERAVEAPAVAFHPLVWPDECETRGGIGAGQLHVVEVAPNVELRRERPVRDEAVGPDERNIGDGARPRCGVEAWNRRRRPGQTRCADLGDTRNEARMHAPATVPQVAEPKVEPGLEPRSEALDRVEPVKGIPPPTMSPALLSVIVLSAARMRMKGPPIG